jgi:predicted O-methyltransferase YrrM
MTNYPNWFSHQEHVFARHLSKWANKPNLEFLQIGTFTGDASVYLLDEILTNETSTLTDVDTWEGSDEPAHKAMDFQDVFNTYKKKVSGYNNVKQFHGTSDAFFAQNEKKFDFIYIDGDHTSKQVLIDAENALRVTNIGGIIAFDDYGWGMQFPIELRPKQAIDQFLYTNKDQLQLLEIDYQVWVRVR